MGLWFNIYLKFNNIHFLFIQLIKFNGKKYIGKGSTMAIAKLYAAAALLSNPRDVYIGMENYLNLYLFIITHIIINHFRKNTIFKICWKY